MWTHFKLDKSNGQFDLFSLGSCDRCQEDIQTPNSVSSPETAARLVSLGMKEYSGRLPSEGGLIEESEEIVCYDCFPG
jgi:hypothetical protein